MQAQGIKDVTLIEPNAGRRSYLGQHLDAEIAETTAAQFGLVMDAVGYDVTRETSSAAVEPGGVILHIGLGAGAGGLDVRRFTLQEVSFIGTYCYTPQDFRDTAQALFDGRLGALDWTEARALSEGAAAFADLDAARVSAPKIVLHPWAD